MFFDLFGGVGAELFEGWSAASAGGEEWPGLGVGSDVGGFEGGEGFFADRDVFVRDLEGDNNGEGDDNVIVKALNGILSQLTSGQNMLKKDVGHSKLVICFRSTRFCQRC